MLYVPFRFLCYHNTTPLLNLKVMEVRFKQLTVFICLETDLKSGVFLKNSPQSLRDSGRRRWNGNTLSAPCASLALAALGCQWKCEIHGRTPAKHRDNKEGRTAVPVARSQRGQWAWDLQPILGKLPGESLFLQSAEEITHIGCLHVV